MKDEPSVHVAANVKLSQSKKGKVCSTHDFDVISGVMVYLWQGTHGTDIYPSGFGFLSDPFFAKFISAP